MTGRAGNQHTVHFPPPVERVAPSTDEMSDKTDIPARNPILECDRPAIVIWGRMIDTASHITKQLKHLPAAEHDYHGTLRMILTASRDLQDNAAKLLKMLDDKGEF